MGSWGSGIFENDHVMDWYCSLEEEGDITRGVSDALDWVINHQFEKAGYGPHSNQDKAAAMAAAALEKVTSDDAVRVVNVDKPSHYLSYDRRFDIGLAAAEMVAAIGGKPMSTGERDILSGAELDVASFVAGRLQLSNDLISKSIQVTDIVLGRKELSERWSTKAVADQRTEKVMDLKRRLQLLVS